MLTREEGQQLNTIWRSIITIWIALFASLPVYLGICLLLDKQQLVDMDPGFPLKIFAFALIAVSLLTLFGTSVVRKKLLTVGKKGKGGDWLQQVKAKYTGATVISAALSESIGVYGLVLFLISQNFVLLCQFLLLSAIAMFFYRPRKAELMGFATEMKKG